MPIKLNTLHYKTTLSNAWHYNTLPYNTTWYSIIRYYVISYIHIHYTMSQCSHQLYI